MDFLLKNLIQSLNDKNEYVRSWAVQLLCEDGKASKAAIDKFVEMAERDPSPVVRLFLSSAMQRIDKEGAWRIAAELVKHNEDIEDHNLPKMIWFGFSQ